nr:MAG TPA: hypothetical protein [Caudoviricetes sp.]
MLPSLANKNTKKRTTASKNTAAVQSTPYSLSHFSEKTITKISNRLYPHGKKVNMIYVV